MGAFDSRPPSDCQLRVFDTFAAERLLAVTVLEDAASADSVGQALAEAGLRCVEVTLRTDSALRTVETMAGIDALTVGAGTVLTPTHVDQAINAGAQFVVSPGLNWTVVQRCQERGVAVIPGVATATEIQSALAMGIDVLKLFPAGPLGGPTMVKALSAPFRRVRFIPTGGVDASSAADYLALPSVLAVGGSWMLPAMAVAARDWDTVRELAAAAVATVRGSGTRATPVHTGSAS
jgi:2-dehydro-3-deoxyphosphogluconate aldolase/(4S)-4-hydroxy-2-oxoglutarate aldolase